MGRKSRILAAVLAGLGLLAVIVAARAHAGGAVQPAGQPPLAPGLTPGLLNALKASQLKTPRKVLEFHDAKALTDWAGLHTRADYAYAATDTGGIGATATADAKTGIMNLFAPAPNGEAIGCFVTHDVKVAPFGKVTAILSTRVEALDIHLPPIPFTGRLLKLPYQGTMYVEFHLDRSADGAKPPVASKRAYISKAGVYDLTLDPTPLEPNTAYLAHVAVHATCWDKEGKEFVKATNLCAPFIHWKFITTPLPIPKAPK
jgi:hypothetical protein